MLKLTPLFALILLLYVGTYIALSFTGGYRVASTGNARIPLLSVSIPDSQQWQPKYLELEVMKTGSGSWTTNGNLGGYIFSPLILIDRKLWHPNKELIE